MIPNVYLKHVFKVAVYSGSHPWESNGVETDLMWHLKLMTHKRAVNDI